MQLSTGDLSLPADHVTARRPGLPDPSKNFTIATSTLNETDGDQYIAQQQRANLEPLFAQYNVSAPAAFLPYAHSGVAQER